MCILTRHFGESKNALVQKAGQGQRLRVAQQQEGTRTSLTTPVTHSTPVRSGHVLGAWGPKLTSEFPGSLLSLSAPQLWRDEASQHALEPQALGKGVMFDHGYS